MAFRESVTVVLLAASLSHVSYGFARSAAKEVSADLSFVSVWGHAVISVFVSVSPAPAYTAESAGCPLATAASALPRILSNSKSRDCAVVGLSAVATVGLCSVFIAPLWRFSKMFAESP